ncbi:MAG: HPF/RaiA family ribosome-associated protein [bacterium]
MNVNIKALGVELTPEITAYLKKKFSSLDKFVKDGDNDAHADIEIGKTTNHHNQGNIFFTEINFRVYGKNFNAKCQGESLMASIDKTKDVALEEIRKHKDILTDHK